MEGLTIGIFILMTLVWFTIGTVIATALVFSTFRWNVMNKILFGYLVSLLFTSFVIDPAMNLLLADTKWVFITLGINLFCIALLAVKWYRGAGRIVDNGS